MNTLELIGWAVAGAMLLAAGVAGSVKRVRLGHAQPVTLAGDSLAVGLGRPMRRHLGTDHPFEVLATEGAFASQTLRRLRGSNLSGRLVLVSAGTNDVSGFATTAGELSRTVREQGGTLAWIAPPPMPPPIDRENAVRSMRSTGDLVLLPPSPLERSSDRIHCTAAGYDRWASHLVRALR